MISPKRTTHLIEHRMGNEVLLYDPVASRTHRLNKAAAMIWDLCDGGHSVEELAGLLTAQFEVEFDRAYDDTQAVVQQLLTGTGGSPATGQRTVPSRVRAGINQ